MLYALCWFSRLWKASAAPRRQQEPPGGSIRAAGSRAGGPAGSRAPSGLPGSEDMGQAGRKGSRGGAAALLIPASRKDRAGKRNGQVDLA